MFYSGSIENRLRFGDIVRGYLSAIPNVKKPFTKGADKAYGIDFDETYSIDILKGHIFPFQKENNLPLFLE